MRTLSGSRVTPRPGPRGTLRQPSLRVGGLRAGEQQVAQHQFGELTNILAPICAGIGHLGDDSTTDSGRQRQAAAGSGRLSCYPL